MRKRKNTMDNIPASRVHQAQDPLERKRPFYTQEELLEVMYGDFIPYVSTRAVVMRCGGDYDLPMTFRG